MATKLVPVEDLTDIQGIHARLQQTKILEAQHDRSLHDLIKKKAHMQARVSTVQGVQDQLEQLSQRSQRLSETIQSTCALAENVSSKVRELDETKSRLSATLQRVDDIIGLRECVSGIQAALGEQNFEQAAIYIRNYLDFDPVLLESESQGAAENDGPKAVEILELASQRLNRLLDEQMHMALTSPHVHDAEVVAQVHRFVKLYPMVKRHNDGVNKLCAFVQRQIEERASTLDDQERDFVTEITAALEGVAKHVGDEAPLLETCFGPGYTALFIKQIQTASDATAVDVLKQYILARDLETLISSVQDATAELDPRELDSVLAEVTLMLARVSLYNRFIRHHVVSDLASLEAAVLTGDHDSLPQLDRHEYDNLVRVSELTREAYVLTSDYISLEEAFLRGSIAKAISVDDAKHCSALTSTVVDDVFFILAKCARRSALTTNVDSTCAMFNHIGNTLSDDVLAYLKKPVDKAASNKLSLKALGGRLVKGLTTQSSENSNETDYFCVILNNLALSLEYMERLAGDLHGDVRRSFGHTDATELTKLQSCIASVDDNRRAFERTLTLGLQCLVKSTALPSIKSAIDAFDFASYTYNENDLREMDGVCPAVANARELFDELIEERQASLLEQNFGRWMLLFTEHLASSMEAAACSGVYTHLGAMQLERDVRAITAFLTSRTDAAIRDKFTRLSQICTVLAVEETNDMHHYYKASNRAQWTLSVQDIKTLLATRQDLDQDSVAALIL